MARPLMQNGIAHLETMFSESGSNPRVLRQLEDELKYRQVPRAVNLLAQVQTALRTAAKSASGGHGAEPPIEPPPPPPPLIEEQSDLWGKKEPDGPDVAVEPEGAVNKGGTAPASRSTAIRPPPVVSVEDAYQMLKATPRTAWEDIEKTRRQLVDAAHPARLTGLASEKRAKVEEAAGRANAAYAVLHARRTTND